VSRQRCLQVGAGLDLDGQVQGLLQTGPMDLGTAANTLATGELIWVNGLPISPQGQPGFPFLVRPSKRKSTFEASSQDPPKDPQRTLAALTRPKPSIHCPLLCRPRSRPSRTGTIGTFSSRCVKEGRPFKGLPEWHTRWHCLSVLFAAAPLHLQDGLRKQRVERVHGGCLVPSSHHL
jgi:hypothetical protein